MLINNEETRSLTLDDLPKEEGDYIRNQLNESISYVTDSLYMQEPKAYAEFYDNQAGQVVKIPYITLAIGLIRTKENIEDNDKTYLSQIKDVIVSLTDEIKRHETPHTRLVKRTPEIELEISEGSKSKNLYFNFYFRVAQVPYFDELKSWNFEKEEGELKLLS